MGSRAGGRLDRERLLQVVQDRLPQLLQGARVRFDPLLRALLRVDGVTESDLYVGLVNMSVQLAHLGLELEPLELELSQEARLALLEEARRDAAERSPSADPPDLRARIRRLEARKLGDLLVREGLITGAQLAEALDAQARVGGRLGTNLVELGCLSDGELAHFLSVQLGVPCVTRLDQLDPTAKDVLGGALARRHQVVPTRLDASDVHLAMADPLDLEAIDAVGAHTGRRVFPVVAPELLVQDALERLYGIPRAQRLHGPPRDRRGTSVAAPPAPRSGPFEPTLDLPGLGAQLAWVQTDGQIFELVLSYLVQRSPACALLRVEDEGALGWSLRGGALSAPRFRALRLEVDEDPVLSRLARAPGSLVLGPERATSWLVAAFGDAEGPVVGGPLRRGVEQVGFWLARMRGSPVELGLDDRFVRMASAALSMVALRQRILAEAS